MRECDDGCPIPCYLPGFIACPTLRSIARVMIRSFSDKRTENVFNGISEKSFPTSILRRARGKLGRINHAARIEDLRAPPGNRLEVLLGDRAGQHSIRVSAVGGYASSGGTVTLGTWS